MQHAPSPMARVWGTHLQVTEQVIEGWSVGDGRGLPGLPRASKTHTQVQDVGVEKRLLPVQQQSQRLVPKAVVHLNLS